MDDLVLLVRACEKSERSEISRGAPAPNAGYACEKREISEISPAPLPLISHLSLISRAQTEKRRPPGAPSPSSDFQRRREPEVGPPTHRRWSIRTPDGKTWDVTQAPPATAGELARSWPAGSTVTPVPDRPRPTDSQALDGAVAARIRAWLASIEEADPAIIGEVLDLCADDPAILAMYLGLAGDVPEKDPWTPDTCGTCAHYRRTSHPYLGHCQAGEPEPAGGLWDSNLRSCRLWRASI